MLFSRWETERSQMKSQKSYHRTPLTKPIKGHACFSLAELHFLLWVPEIAAKQPNSHRMGWLQLHSHTDPRSAQVALSKMRYRCGHFMTVLCRACLKFLSSRPWFDPGRVIEMAWTSWPGCPLDNWRYSTPGVLWRAFGSAFPEEKWVELCHKDPVHY